MGWFSSNFRVVPSLLMETKSQKNHDRGDLVQNFWSMDFVQNTRGLGSNLVTLRHCGSLTWLAGKWTRIESMYFLLKMWIFHCYVGLPEGSFAVVSWGVKDSELRFFGGFQNQKTDGFH